MAINYGNPESLRLAEQLNKLQNVDIRAVDKGTLEDMSSFQFNNALSHQERVKQLLEHLKNPYCFRVGQTAVKVEFSDSGPRLQNVIAGFLIRQKSGL